MLTDVGWEGGRFSKGYRKDPEKPETSLGLWQGMRLAAIRVTNQQPSFDTRPLPHPSPGLLHLSRFQLDVDSNA